jgi:hypothetical protein
MSARLAALRRLAGQTCGRSGIRVRLPAAALAAVLLAVPVAIAPVQIVAIAALLALLMAALGIALCWRWATTAAACAFLTAYAGAVWVMDAPGAAALDIDPARVMLSAGFGLGLVLMLHAVDLARALRHAAIQPGVVRSVASGWAALGAATLAATALVAAVARGVTPAIPFGVAPLTAAAAAVGIAAALVLAVSGARSGPRQRRDQPDRAPQPAGGTPR